MRSGKGVKQLQYQLFNGALFLLLSIQYTYAQGNVGCLYSNQLCDEKTEWCFNDYAFGRCVYRLDFSPDDLYRYKFKYNDLEKLKDQLEELKSLGFNWKHPYTQCVIQTQLQTVKLGVPYSLESCERILKEEFPDPIQLLQYGRKNSLYQQNDDFALPRSVSEGIIKFEPDDKTRPVSNTKAFHQQRPPDYDNDLINQLRLEAEMKPGVHKKSAKSKSTSTRYRGTPLYLPPHNRHRLKNEIIESDDTYDSRYSPVDNENFVLPAENTNYDDDDLRALEKTLHILENERGKTYTEGGPMYISDGKDEYENSVYGKMLDHHYEPYGSDIFGFKRRERLDVKKPGPPYKVNDYAFRNMNYKSTDTNENKPDESIQNNVEEFAKKVHRNINSERLRKEQKSEYEYVPNYIRSENSQSPLQYVTIETNNKNLSRAQATKLLGTIRNLRRLPAGTFKNMKLYDDRIIYFDVGANIINYSANDISRIIRETIADSPVEDIEITAVYVGLPREMTKGEQPSEDLTSCDTDDSEFTLLQLNRNISGKIIQKFRTPAPLIRILKQSDSWVEADNIVSRLNTFFKLPPKTFYCTKGSGSEIAFKVRNNSKNFNASTVANILNAKKDKIRTELNVEILSASFKNHDHPNVRRLLPESNVQRLLSESENGYFKITFILCGVVAAVVVSTIALFFVKRQAKIKEKLNGLPRAKDLIKNYRQDSTKGRFNNRPVQEISVPGQRIASLSRESDNSPSSRSSTSSWSEEPMSNMDITTGHMVLAYMEDHLTNKARLDTEWAALCAYDADPCSVAIAQQPENIRKNRYVNALPYDHARVVLNALSNVNGCDYINASTMTDHDPRNPAYIATQGPLENTVCDFWQMLWEQGCNIIVMLTRLIENDTAMCYRYWPSEGVELYNIYEVHLVSEHIWCDDFIVRSFYLKNQATTETRTITQFHFLTWPEGGIPPAAKPLLEFRRKVNKSFREKNHPILVHCSDGVGRTGSYLLLDMVLNRISKGAKEIDIAATLEHIRDQRAGAVCTKQQFQFVLSAVAEEVQAVLKALPQQQQTSQDQNTDNVAPLVQLSEEPSEQEAAATSNNTDKSTSESASNSNSLLN